jgi:hypothetical protein
LKDLFDAPNGAVARMHEIGQRVVVERLEDLDRLA